VGLTPRREQLQRFSKKLLGILGLLYLDVVGREPCNRKLPRN
jgi:hypothetical protein